MDKKYIPNSVLRQIGFVTITVLLFLFLTKNISSFIPGLLGAICLYILLITPLKWIIKKRIMNTFFSVMTLMLTSIVTVITPILLLIFMLTKKVSGILHQKELIQSYIEKTAIEIHSTFGFNILDEKYITDITHLGVQMMKTVINTSLDSILQLGVAFLILYFMLMNHRRFEVWFYKNTPLKRKNFIILNKDLRDLVISNAIAVPLVAFFQACVAYLGYLLFGVDDAFSWFIITIFGAMMPIVGAALIYIPVVIIMLAQGETTNAYLLLAFCVVIVGSIDNVFRLILQKKMADIHPLITIFGVIVGLNVFGFIGIIFGPILFSALFWLFRLYKIEFIDNN